MASFHFYLTRAQRTKQGQYWRFIQLTNKTLSISTWAMGMLSSLTFVWTASSASGTLSILAQISAEYSWSLQIMKIKRNQTKVFLLPADFFNNRFCEMTLCRPHENVCMKMAGSMLIRLRTWAIFWRQFSPGIGSIVWLYNTMTWKIPLLFFHNV